MTAAAGTEGTELAEVVDAELVDDDQPARWLPATVAVPGPSPEYRITRDTLLVEGELPPRVDEQPAFTERDFIVPPSAKRRAEERGARNTRVNRDTTRDRFEEWCVKEGRIARPATTTANVVAYFDHLMEVGTPASSPGTPRASGPTAPSSGR
ncbi:hypothetical protein [Streptomyces sp. NBC_01320]|uniref:hypothetical protein n=1 Tax=Streptomyces sp. NBC_01320 TaxID=2903824 RepID=UPI002E0F6937|nr:hypothetical protein OG395_03105 [Streptomyces sp. NBC_01320]